MECSAKRKRRTYHGRFSVRLLLRALLLPLQSRPFLRFQDRGFRYGEHCAEGKIQTLGWRAAFGEINRSETARFEEVAGYGGSTERCAELRLTQRILSRRSEEHTSELQSLRHLVCRLL